MGCPRPKNMGRSRARTTHNMSRTPEYKVWGSMIRRCTVISDRSYVNYGARGISVCQRWMESFEAFIHDMGKRPGKFWIDRINNNGNYEPSNCKWSSPDEQAKNKRNSLYVECFGESKTLAQWAEDSRCMVNRNTLKTRWYRGWRIEAALQLGPTPYGHLAPAPSKKLVTA